MNLKAQTSGCKGFTVIELIIAMTIILIALGIVSSLFAWVLGVRSRESSRTDAMTAAQAALNVMSREISNAGYGLTGNGIIYPDSTTLKLHITANTTNTNNTLTDVGENLTFYWEPATQSILRYDPHGNGPNSPQTAVLINRVSSVSFQYFDYVGSSSTGTLVNPPTVNTGRIRIRLTVELEQVQGQSNPSSVVLVSDVTLRNAPFMLQQY
jgi:prepilin-type N-terminal cleavage/methylation domain-containing protein